ncbi:hypothetical protein [Allorhodopirellula heiligendammensis]|uniref:DUF998 domain-containing protein n=1 Tax=Allorhodopirellula heiligendammensis TaxID=2714739 RepID=A0A5C6C6M4_9BACT|nr:hypothetical protein [Allorhodopirellula heiligendammensis]TWU19116.1 hypothetical protein Poly21_12870 [Allorhodopirellula heiligendammensis]
MRAIPELPDQTNVLVISYLTIRRAIGISGLALPVVLLVGGWITGIPIQDNMSSYYHTGMRDVFVGTLCAIGVFLFCYQGYGWAENWTANLGGVSALGIALCPLDFNSDPLLQKSVHGYLHTFSGGVFFSTLAFYSLYHFPRESRLEAEPHLWERKWIYRTSGIVILVSLLTMGIYLFFLDDDWKQLLTSYHFLFWMEWIAVWSFAAAWLARGRAIIADIAVDVLAYSSELLLKKRHAGSHPGLKQDEDLQKGPLDETNSNQS